MLQINRKTMVAVYEMLCEFPPYNRWQLPKSKDVKFEAKIIKEAYGYYDSDPHTIIISKNLNPTLHDLVNTMAHEMVHMRLNDSGFKSWDLHSFKFKKVAKQVCDRLGFNEKEF